MAARVTRLEKRLTGALLIAAIMSLISCASEKQPVSVVKDSETQKESAIPWNKQEKWEAGANTSALGPMGATSDRAR
jgi:hypothetical protein